MKIYTGDQALTVWTNDNTASESRKGFLRVAGSGASKRVEYLQFDKGIRGFFEKGWHNTLHFFGIGGTNLKTIVSEFAAHPEILKRNPNANTLLALKIIKYDENPLHKCFGKRINEGRPTHTPEAPAPNRSYNINLKMSQETLDKYRNGTYSEDHFMEYFTKNYFNIELIHPSDKRPPFLETLKGSLLKTIPNSKMKADTIEELAFKLYSDEKFQEILSTYSLPELKKPGADRKIANQLQADLQVNFKGLVNKSLTSALTDSDTIYNSIKGKVAREIAERDEIDKKFDRK